MGSKRYSKPRLRKQVSSICIECEARTLTQLNTSITTQLLFIFSVALYSISCERSEGLPMTTACFSVALCVVVGSLEDERPSQIRHGLTRPLRSAEGKRRGREKRDRGAREAADGTFLPDRGGLETGTGHLTKKGGRRGAEANLGGSSTISGHNREGRGTCCVSAPNLNLPPIPNSARLSH